MRRLSGAAGAAAVQCGVDITLSFSPEVLLVHKSKRGDSIPIPQTELKAVLASFIIVIIQVLNRRKHRTEVTFSQSGGGSAPRFSRVYFVRSGGGKNNRVSSNHRFRCEAVLRSKGAFTLHPAQVDPLLYSFK